MGVAFRDLSGQIVMDVVAELRALDIPGDSHYCCYPLLLHYFYCVY